MLLFHRFLGFGLGLDLLLQISLWFSVSFFFQVYFFFLLFLMILTFGFETRLLCVCGVFSCFDWIGNTDSGSGTCKPWLDFFFINLFIFCLNWVFQEYFFCNFCDGYLVWILLMILWIWYYIFSYSKLWFRVFFLIKKILIWSCYDGFWSGIEKGKLRVLCLRYLMLRANDMIVEKYELDHVD